MNWLSLRGPFEPLAPTHQLADPLCKRYVVTACATPTAYRLIDSGSFHRFTTFFSTFPHGTYTLSLNTPYLALEDGSPLFEQVFSRFTLFHLPLTDSWRKLKCGSTGSARVGRPVHINTGLSPSSVRLSSRLQCTHVYPPATSPPS